MSPDRGTGAAVILRCGWQQETTPSFLVGRHSVDHCSGDVSLMPPLPVLLDGANVDLDAMHTDEVPGSSSQAGGYVVDEVNIHQWDVTR